MNCSRIISRSLAVAALLGGAFGSISMAWAAAPKLFSTTAHQTPVRGDPDDLLIIPGSGLSTSDVVVYQRITANTPVALVPPASVPATSTDIEGVAAIVSSSSVPHSLTVRLPQQMLADRPYALWARNSAGEWSNGVKINDARPLWITPGFAYSTAQAAYLPRELKVVGRNLQPAPGAITEVRLIGPQRFTLPAANDGDSSTAIEHYVAKASLPSYLPPGTYVVKVRRDNYGWVELQGQTLTVLADPAAPAVFPVSDSGGCVANDGNDDTACILAAIASAKSTGGGTVTFGPGVWNLINSSTAGLVHGEGIVVPPGVSLRGAGAALTTLVRADAWWTPSTPSRTEATITLQGRNTICGFTFKDEHVYSPGHHPVSFLKLGKRFDRNTGPGDPPSVDDVVISSNVFDRPFTAVADGGLPINRLFVTYNEFGAFYRGLAPSGHGNNVATRFRINDSVIAHNTFRPGSYLDVAQGQGTIASTLGASYRVDFSNNVADGTSTAFLNNPDDAKGWRAAFFWHMRDNHELTLVSQNEATCTGDKAGDGESFAFDDSGNSYAFERAQSVIAASSDSLTVNGPLRSTPGSYTVNPASYYIGNWIYIAEGAGLGQARRIASYTIDPQSSQVTFNVSPAWDVTPAVGARVTVARLFWQVYAVDNFVDHRQPLCLKSNRTRPKGGVIGYWARMSDSTLEGNRQYDTDGLLLQQSYSAVDSSCPSCRSNGFQQLFTEVRGNLINGEYDWDSDCSWSGIQSMVGAAPIASSPPPTLGYGVSIAHNTVTRADGIRGGAISVPLTWHAGPPPNNWPLVDNILVFHNTVADLTGARPSATCGAYPHNTRIGVNVQNALVWRTALYGNTCQNVTTPIVDAGSQTNRICAPPASGSWCAISMLHEIVTVSR